MPISESTWEAALPSLITAIGEPVLAPRLIDLLRRLFGAQHAAVFSLQGDGLAKVMAASADGSGTAERQVRRYLADNMWQADPTIAEARQSSQPLTLLRTDIAGLASQPLRNDIYIETNVKDRIFLCGRLENGLFGLSILSSGAKGAFSDRELDQLHMVGGTLLAIVARHAGLANLPDVSRALTSLAEIEACMADLDEPFPRRENEVCTRIIYGISTLGIALELEISEETVVTYRKRAYHRLGIATQRELILWYLDHWNRWTKAGRQPPGPVLAN